MTNLLTVPKKEARKKGFYSLASLIVGSGLLITGFTKIGAVLLVLTIWLTARWLIYRGKWGLRF